MFARGKNVLNDFQGLIKWIRDRTKEIITYPIEEDLQKMEVEWESWQWSFREFESVNWLWKIRGLFPTHPICSESFDVT